MNRPNHSIALYARRRATRGLSLVETAMALSITTLALGAALPGFGASIERRHLEGVAAQFETDVQFTRSLAVSTQRDLRIGFGSSAGGTCYVIHTGAAGECTCGEAGAACTGEATALRQVYVSADARVALVANVRSMLIDAEKGTVTPTVTVQVRARDGRALHQIVNIMGRVRSCSPEPGLAGYRPC